MPAASCYRSGTSMVDLRNGILHDYSDRDGVSETLILLPPGAPERYFDREFLWNQAEASERRHDAVVGREINIGLPHQLSREGRRRAALRMAQWLVDHYGVAVDIAFHDPSNKPGHDKRNYHVHILFSARALTPEGFGEKTRILDVKATSSVEVRKMRQAWQDFANEELEREGIDVRIDCRSLKDQGITDRLPQIHEGVVVRAMLDRGVDPAEIRKLKGRPVSTPAEDQSRHRPIDYEKYDDGQNRSKFNGNIITLNDHANSFGPIPLEEQIRRITLHLPELMEKVTDLEALVPRGLLPMWAQVRLEWGWYRMKAMFARLLQEKEEERERLEEEQRIRERRGIHEQIRNLKDKIARLETVKRQLQAVQRLFMRIEAVAVMRPPIARDSHPPPRLISEKQFRVELHFKAEMARAKVPPEYRPRIERPAPAGQGSLRSAPKAQFTAAVKGPPDNGGLAKRPPALKGKFNAQADPAQPAYRSQVKIAFGPKTR